MTSKMRFGEQVKASDTARRRELMPQGFADDAQSEVGYDFFTDTPDHFHISKEVCRTAFRVYQPLSAKIHDDCFSTTPTTNGDRLQGEVATCKAGERWSNNANSA